MNRRALAAVAVLTSWVAGLGLLVRRELFTPDLQRFAEAGMRVTPSATFYAVHQAGRHIGFASSSVDTTSDGVQVVDYLVADLPAGGRVHRASARTTVRLSRGLRLQGFVVQVEGAQGSVGATGTVDGDSVVILAVRTGDAPADTQRIPVQGPILLPTLVPLAVALSAEPEVGREYQLPLFDPTTMAPRTVPVRLEAESLFVVNDSAVFDTAARRWVGVLPDTVRAWHVAPGDRGIFSGWVDAQGRVVQATQAGMLTLRRVPYELAFENWQLQKRDGGAPPPGTDEDVLETTAIAAAITRKEPLAALTVRLRGVSLEGFDLRSPRQALTGDTLRVTREDAAHLEPGYRLGDHPAMPGIARGVRNPYLGAEPLIESTDPAILDLAFRLRDGTTDPAVFAMRVNRWVRDSLAKRPTIGVPSARAVLQSRAGDCNEHTQLYVALARAGRLPARAVAGLVYVNGKFHYHAWPEVWLRGWVAVDPTLGQFPADASHLRFVVGGLGRQAELLRLIGNLEVDVLAAE